MIPLSKLSQPWHAGDVDRLMLVLLALNLAGALAVGAQHGQTLLATQVGAALVALPALLVWRLRGTLRSALALAAALVGLVALQIHLSGGALVHHFNVFVTLSLLLVYRDWRLIAAAAGLFAVHHVAFDRLLANGVQLYCLSAPDPAQVLLHVGFVAVQALLLGLLAWRDARAARESQELAVLVNAMGRDGPIRLNLAVMRAETTAGQRLQHVQQRMAAAIGAVQAAAQRIEAAAGEVADGSQALMRRTEATAAGLKDSAMCLDQIGVIVQHSTEASTEARAMSGTAAGMADDGNRLVAEVVRTMQGIESGSHRISEITAVIDGIAFQTNILALNAAVEAARAGDAGRGFAVVAGEVRNLARRSAEAAREIKVLIGTAVATAESGTRLVGGAGQTMTELVSSVRRVGELFQGMMADTSEQMQGLRTVSASVAELGDATQQNVAVADRAGRGRSRPARPGGQPGRGAERLPPGGRVRRGAGRLRDRAPIHVQ